MEAKGAIKMWWQNFKSLLFRIFHRKTVQTDVEHAIKSKMAAEYENIKDINFTAIISNKLASLTVSDSKITVEGDGKRAEQVGELLNAVWAHIKSTVAASLGYGSVYIVPYCAGGKIYTDVVPQSRIYATELRGDDLIACTIISDVITRDSHTYMRLTDYSLEAGGYKIQNKAIKDGNIEVPLQSISEWAGIPPEIRIGNVDRLLMGCLRCPVDNRNCDNNDGVPITFGAEDIISQVKECLSQIRREYKLKEAFVGVDATLFGVGDNKQELPADGLFKTFDEGSDEFWQVFDPAIRDTAYQARLNQLFELLEKSIGLSKGVLTNVDSQNSTATEIRRSTHDTWAMVDSIRAEVMSCFNSLAYAFDVLCNYYSLTPPGEYKLSFDWDYSLLEDSQESFGQLMQAQSLGAVDEVEVRQFIFPNETREEAERAVEAIAKAKPKVNDVIGEE